MHINMGTRVGRVSRPRLHVRFVFEFAPRAKPYRFTFRRAGC
jgi:hypothetical protein